MAFRRPARTLWALWRAERHTLGQGLVALVLSTAAGFVAGLTLAHLTDRLDRLPGLLVLIPAAVGMRGTIFGAIGARLGTPSAAGLFEASLRRDGVLCRNAEVAVLTTLTSAVWLAVLARLASAAFGHPSISVWDLVTISMVGGALGSVVILAVTAGLSVAFAHPGVGTMVEGALLAGSMSPPILLVGGYALAVVTTRFGLDPDDHAVPIVTSVMDLAGVAALLLAMSALGVGVR
jgi:mgtE-like transporter